MLCRMLCLLAILVIISSSGLCDEIGYIYSEDGEYELDNATIKEHLPSYVVNFTTAGPEGSGTTSPSQKNLGELQRIFDARVETDKVRKQAVEMTRASSGYQTIDQVCLIYETLKNSWDIKGDPRGVDYFASASETLELGEKSGYTGAGDCDDFAILMASMVEAIGGTTRIILAKGPTVSHAYAEVYLGNINDNNTGRISGWLRHKYGVKKINTHKDLKTGDIWLNLDWGNNLRSAAYPGYRFIDAAEHVPAYINSDKAKQKLNPSPLALFTISTGAIAGQPVAFNASESLEVADITKYHWDFGDGAVTEEGPMANHTFARGDSYNVTLEVTDDLGSFNSTCTDIKINDPMGADFTIDPEKPIAGDLVVFDPTTFNISDESNLSYFWEFDNLETSKLKSPEKRYPKSGTYWVNLTINNEGGCKDSKSRLIKVNEKPIAQFEYDSKNLNAGEMISFDASSSKDSDGEIESYIWDFGDKSEKGEGKTAQHSFFSGGSYIVELQVEDNDGATSSLRAEMSVNSPPNANFDYNPLEPEAEEIIKFDASSSEDPDPGEKIVLYSWDWGEGRVPEDWKMPIAKHAYDESGEYEVTLITKDSKGAVGSFVKKVVVADKSESNDQELKDIGSNLPTAIASFAVDEASPSPAGTTFPIPLKAAPTERFSPGFFSTFGTQTPAQLLEAPLGSELLYSDDFSNIFSGWTVGTSITNQGDAVGGQGYENGQYYIDVAAYNRVVYGFTNNIFQDFILEVEATLTRGLGDSDCGVMLRYVDGYGYYRFKLSGDGKYGFDKFQYGLWTDIIPWTYSDAILTGRETNLIQIKCEGNKFTFYVNGVKLAECTDSSFGSGKIGLDAGTGLGDNNVHANFDNLKIWSINLPVI